MTTDVINGVPRSLLERCVLLAQDAMGLDFDEHAAIERDIRELLATAQPADHSEHALNMVSQPAAEVIETDCRSEEGVTVGLIDALIAICRPLATRDLATPAACAALEDLRSDSDALAIFLGLPPAADGEREAAPGWAHWAAGDTVRYVSSGGFIHARMTVDSDYLIHEAPDDCESMLVLDDDGDELSVLVGEFEWQARAAQPQQAVAVTDEVRRDAERYRYIRSEGIPDEAIAIVDSYHGELELVSPKRLDAAIDAALSAHKTGEEE